MTDHPSLCDLPPELIQEVAREAGPIATLCLAGTCRYIRWALSDAELLNSILFEAVPPTPLRRDWVRFGPATNVLPHVGPPPQPTKVSNMGLPDGPLGRGISEWLAGVSVAIEDEEAPLRRNFTSQLAKRKDRDWDNPAPLPPIRCVADLRDIDIVAPVEAFYLRLYYFWWMPAFPAMPTGLLTHDRAAPWTSKETAFAAIISLPVLKRLHTFFCFPTTWPRLSPSHRNAWGDLITSWRIGKGKKFFRALIGK